MSAADSRLAVTDVAGLVAIDRISVSFPVVDYDPSVFRRRAEDRDPGTGELVTESMGVNIRMPGGDGKRGSAYVGVQYRAGVGFWGKVEANPAPWFRDDYEPVGYGDLEAVAEHMQDLLEQACVEPTRSGPGSWKVNRIDFLRTIHGVAAPERTLGALENVRRKYRPVVALWSDAHRRGAQTLAVKAGGGIVRVYDGQAAYGLPAGTFRAEVQANQAWLRKVGIERLGDMTEFQCQALIAERWNWSRMGDAVVGAQELVSNVARQVAAGGYVDGGGEWRDVSATKARRLLGEFVLECRGVAWGQSNTATVEYERWKRALGLVPSPEAFSAVEEVATRLDYVAGREVVEGRGGLRAVG